MIKNIIFVLYIIVRINNEILFLEKLKNKRFIYILKKGSKKNIKTNFIQILLLGFIFQQD